MSAEPIETERIPQVVQVASVMTRPVVTVERGTSIGSAIDVALTAGHTHLVVTDERRVLLDIVPVSSLSTALLTRLVTRFQPIGDALASAPVHVRPDDALADAVAAMLEHRTDAVGVVDDLGHLVGLLTWPDIGRHIVDPTDHIHPRRP